MAEIFDSEAKKYDGWYETEMGKLVHEIEMDMVMDLLKPEKGQKALDFGCGTGHYSIELAKRGLDVTAIDLSEEMMSYAKKKSSKLGLSINWMIQDAQDLPFEDATFDRAVSVTALEFFPEPSKALREVYRVLKPGGRMVVGVIGGESSWSKKYEEKARAEEDSVFKYAKFYTPQELLNLLPEVDGEVRKGLYFPPTRENFDRDRALELEKEGRKKDESGAGFIAALWKK